MQSFKETGVFSKYDTGIKHRTLSILHSFTTSIPAHSVVIYGYSVVWSTNRTCHFTSTHKAFMAVVKFLKKSLYRIPETKFIDLWCIYFQVKDQMTEVLGSDMKSVIRPLPKYSPSYTPGTAVPHTEIVLYEDHRKAAEKQRLARTQYVHINTHYTHTHTRARSRVATTS